MRVDVLQTSSCRRGQNTAAPIFPSLQHPCHNRTICFANGLLLNVPSGVPAGHPNPGGFIDMPGDIVQDRNMGGLRTTIPPHAVGQ